MASNQEEEGSGVTLRADPRGDDDASDAAEAGSATDSSADVEAAAANIGSVASHQELPRKVPGEVRHSSSGDAENEDFRGTTDTEKRGISGALTVLRERSRTTTSPPRRTRFEVLEIDDKYFDDDDDLHLTEYELEQQHQMEEEDRKLLSAELSRGGGEGDETAGESAARVAAEWPSSAVAGPLPSLPARCLHLCAKAVLADERSTKPMRVGNVSIFAPSCWYRTGWGTLGPHWFGPLIVAALASSAGYFFFHEARRDVGAGSAAVCAVFSFATLYHLANASLRDPGIVNTRRYQARLASSASSASPANESSGGESESPELSSSDPSSPERPAAAVSPPSRRSRTRRRDRWCDYCHASQPPDGAHCLDCGVCVAGYDHHCVWMGTCIGKGNFKQFLRFNLCWLAFLLFAIVWVSILGPKIFDGK